MTHSADSENGVIDRLVREYVERESDRCDSSSLIARVLADRTKTSSFLKPSREYSPLWKRSFMWSSMMGLAVLIAFIGGRYFNGQAANASMVLRNVQSEHTRPIDYCYRVQFDPDPRHWDKSKKLDGPSSSLLWTRGDRFWSDCVIGDFKFKLGREVNGTVWISPSPEKGIRFTNDASHLPKAVSQICQINSMSVPQLMNEVLRDFDLNSDRTTEASLGMHTLIWARLKPGQSHDMFTNALLEIDSETNVLVRLVLWMVRDQQPRGTVTFTLLESDHLSDNQYQLDSHLDTNATIELQTLATPDYEPDLTNQP